MAWTPAYAATDIRKILGNLITFFTANQVEALAWASPLRLLTPLTFYRTAEGLIKDDFPHFVVSGRRVTTGLTDAGLQIRYDLTFQYEVFVSHTKDGRTTALTQLVLDIDNYTYALESMFLNIPQATLFANVTGAGTALKQWESSDPVEKAISDTKSVFNVEARAVLEFLETADL